MSKEEHNEVNKDDGMFLEYSVPFTNSAEIDGDFSIEGVAINETTTSNGHKFLGEELRSSAQSMVGVPLLKDHDNSVDSIVGRVKNAHFDEALRNIPFKAVIKDEKMKQLVKQGLLNTVSVGAHVDPKNIEETEDGEIIPHGIIFKELSLVAVPADSGATFDIALNNAWKARSHSTKVDNSQSIERGNMTMTKEITENTEEVKSEETEEEKEVKDESESSEESEVEERIKKVELALKKQKLAKLEAQLKESDEDEPEEKEEESKEEEEESEDEEEVEEAGDYAIKQSGTSFTSERRSYNYN